MKINCGELSDTIIRNAKWDACCIAAEYGRYPMLAIIQVGHNAASDIYVRNKVKACKEASIEAKVIEFPDTITEEVLLREISNLNSDNKVDGIIVQLPLPKHISEEVVKNQVDPVKDVDGFNCYNVGKLQETRNPINCGIFLPATVHGINILLNNFSILVTDAYQENYFKGKNAVVIGRSEIVGKPCAQILLKHDMTVTICHSHTQDLQYYVKNADVIIVAAGVPNLLKGSMIKDGALVIDVGINRVDGKLCGDFDPELKEDETPRFHYTPVPGGVGKLTTASVTLKTIYSAWTHLGELHYE